MATEGFAKPWVEFEEDFGERMLLKPPISRMKDQFMRFGSLMDLKYTFPKPDPSVKTEDTIIDSGTKARIYTPDGYTGGKPVCIYFHGGGWAMGDVNGDDPYSRAISKAGGIVVISVEYGLAPENKHRSLMDECFNAMVWALDNSNRLNTARGKFLTAGLSAGGQLAFATALRAVDERLGEIVGVVALIPVTIHPDGVPDILRPQYTAMEEHDQHTINTAAAMREFWDAFGVPPTDPYGSPLLHPEIRSLKKVYLAVAGHDTLRDDGLLMKMMLDDAGTPVRFDLYNGYPHFFFAWPSPKLAQPQKEFMDNLAEGVKYVLAE